MSSGDKWAGKGKSISHPACRDDEGGNDDGDDDDEDMVSEDGEDDEDNKEHDEDSNPSGVVETDPFRTKDCGEDVPAMTGAATPAVRGSRRR